MLVVDRSVFSQLQADHTGIDFMELSANIIRAHHMRHASTPSIFDSETTSKGLSPTSLGFSPPSYDDIFGDKPYDLPPSYSEVSLMLRHMDQKDFVFPRVPFANPKEDLQSVVVLDRGPNESVQIRSRELGPTVRGCRVTLTTRSESALDDSPEDVVQVSVLPMNNCVPSSRSCSSMQFPASEVRESTL